LENLLSDTLNQHARAAETIGSLEKEPGQEREFNRQLQEYNTNRNKIYLCLAR